MTTRKYTAQEIIDLIGILKSSGEIPPSELAGMEFLRRLIGQLDTMSDAEIAEEALMRW
jgi:hypothetical protein